MGPPGAASRRAAVRLALPLAVLAALHLTTFQDHYFRGFGFQWDFPQAYYGMGAFAVSALTRGELPEWMPFQCMGYPYLLNPQSGFFYPPLWLLALLGFDYTLHTATVLQCLHVLFGAIGMFFLARRVAGSAQLALVGAAMYHFFGGFYCNAQHVDIVRAFALVPWVFHALTFHEEAPGRLGRGCLLLPLWLFLLATGGYPGNLIATTLAAPLYLGLQLAAALRRGAERITVLRTGALAAALMATGLALAAVHLGPLWLHLQAFRRAAATDLLQHYEVWSTGPGTLLFSGRFLPSLPDISMSSTFVTMPAFLLVFFVGGRELKCRWPLAAVTLYALLMAGGPRSIVWRTIAELFPPARFSRFPTSDYRPLIALGVIALAVLGLRAVLRRGGRWHEFVIRSGLGLGALLLLAVSVFGSLRHAQVIHASLAAAATLGLLAWLRHRGSDLGWAPALLLVGLVGADALRVLPDMETWHHPEISALYARHQWSSETPAELARSDGLEAQVEVRPAREEVGHPNWFSWAGYLQARYMLDDRAPCLLSAAHEARRRGKYAAYMRRAWAPLLLDPAAVEWTAAGLHLEPYVYDRAGASAPGRSVTQVRYGLDEIVYAVTLRQPTLMIENEIYFPGWTATLEGPAGRRRITAAASDGVFRAWKLPVGSYRMVARFRTPGLRAAAAVGLLGLASWAACLAAWQRLGRLRAAAA